MNAYAEPVRSLTDPLTAVDIDKLFRKPGGWFSRDVVRKRLYSKGFPHPFERGLWSAKAVADWLAAAGSNPDHVAPRKARQRPRKAPRANAYTPVAG